MNVHVIALIIDIDVSESLIYISMSVDNLSQMYYSVNKDASASLLSCP